MSDTIVFTVPGMTCGHCVRAVHDELVAVAGVAHADVDLDTKIVRVVGDGLDRDELIAAVDEAGYEAVFSP